MYCMYMIIKLENNNQRRSRHYYAIPRLMKNARSDQICHAPRMQNTTVCVMAHHWMIELVFSIVSLNSPSFVISYS